MVNNKDKDNSSNSLVFGRWPQTKTWRELGSNPRSFDHMTTSGTSKARNLAIFCNTSLPQARTRWFRWILSSLCPLFKAAPSISLCNIKRKFIWNPGLLGEKQLCYLCAVQPPFNLYFEVKNLACTMIRILGLPA